MDAKEENTYLRKTVFDLKERHAKEIKGLKSECRKAVVKAHSATWGKYFLVAGTVGVLGKAIKIF